MTQANERGTPTYEGRPLPRPGRGARRPGAGLRRRHAAEPPAAAAGCSGSGRRPSGWRPAGRGSSSSTGVRATSSSSARGDRGVGEIPDETAGPYPGDGSNGPDVLEQSGIVRSDIRSSFGDVQRHGRGRADDAGADHHRPRQRRRAVRGRRRLRLALQPRGRLLAVLRGRRPTRTTCAACRSPTPTAGSPSPASSRPATAGAGRTSTSRSTPTRPASPTPRTPSPRRRSPCRRTSARPVYATSGYEASVGNLARVSLDSDNVFGDDGAASQSATVTGDVASGYTVSLAVGVDTTTAPTAGSRSATAPRPACRAGPAARRRTVRARAAPRRRADAPGPRCRTPSALSHAPGC